MGFRMWGACLKGLGRVFMGGFRMWGVMEFGSGLRSRLERPIECPKSRKLSMVGSVRTGSNLQSMSSTSAKEVMQGPA